MAKKPTNIDPDELNPPRRGEEPESDEEILRGHPAQGDEPEPEPEPEPNDRVPEKKSVKVRIGETEFDADPAMAALLQQQQSMIEELKATRAAPAPAPKEEDDSEDFDQDAFYADPAKFIAEKVNKAVSKAREDMTNEYGVDQRRRDFWGTFYSKHDDLTSDKDVVETVVNANWDSLKNLPPATAMDKIAEMSRERLLAIAKRFGKGTGEGNRTVVEGEGNRDTPRGRGGDSPKVMRLSDIIKARQAKRSGAA
jgi:hypothetical protein